MNSNTNFISDISRKLLKSFFIDNPTAQQLTAAESFLSKVICEENFVFDYKLTRKESLCLYWVAQGKSTVEIAEILRISLSTVKTHKNRIMKKLDCKNMVHAVYQGMKYAYICPNMNGGLRDSKESTFWTTIFL